MGAKILEGEIKEVHISTIRPEDTILHNDGLIRTVNRENIKECEFMGVSLFGNSYLIGTQLVRKVLL